MKSGTAQLEINFLHGDALPLADKVLLFKRLTRQAASESACMPPSWPSRSRRRREASMHLHIRSSTRAGNTLFAERDDADTEDVRPFHRRPAEICARRSCRCLRRT